MSVREDLKAYLDGELNAARAEEVRLAIEGDPALQQEVQFMKLLEDTIREEAAEPEVAGFENTVEAVKARRGLSWPVLRKPIPRWLILGAAGLSVIALASLMAPGNGTGLVAANDMTAARPTSPADLSVSPAPGGHKVMPGISNPSDVSSGMAVPKSEFLKRSSELRKFSEGPDAGINASSSSTPTAEGTVASQPAAGDPATKAPRSLLTAPSNRKIIQNGEADIEVADAAAAQNRANQVAVGFGGFSEDSSLNYLPSGGAQSTVTLRVPAHYFAQALSQIESLGKVKSNNVTGEDVTAQYADTDARLKELGAEEDDYVTMLRGARTIGQILEIKDRLSDVRQSIASLHEQLETLKDQSSMSTLAVTFDQKPAAGGKAASKGSADNWADDTFSVAAKGLSSTLKFLARGVIFLFVYAPIWIPVVVIGWWFNRRSKATK